MKRACHSKRGFREYRFLDEEILPSKNDELTCSLVEPYIEVKDGRYEIPVPFKSEVLKTLPNNYDCALKRTLSMRRTACKNPHLKQTLTDTFTELIENGWIVPAGSVEEKRSRPLRYLPFFVTHTAKPRVVYDGAATTSEGASLNQAVWAGRVNSSDGRVVWSVCLLSCRLGFDSESGQTNDFKIGIHSFPA